MGRREVEVEKAELFAHQPLGSVVIRHDAHLAGAAMAAGTIEALSLLAPLQIDAQGMVTRIVIAGLIIAVAPAGHPKAGLQPAGIFQPRSRADQCIKYARLSYLLHLAASPIMPCGHLTAPLGQTLRPCGKNRKMVQASRSGPRHAASHALFT